MSASSTDGLLSAVSNDLAAAVDTVGRSVVAIHARRRIPASGVVWQPGVVVAAHHTIQRDDDITISQLVLALGRPGGSVTASLGPVPHCERRRDRGGGRGRGGGAGRAAGGRAGGDAAGGRTRA